MPKNRLQETVFTIMMVLVMVYAMICYNIALETGGMKNFVFKAALGEFPIMIIAGFILDTFIAGPIARIIAIGLRFQNSHTGKGQTYCYNPCNFRLLNLVHVPYDELYRYHPFQWWF